MRVESVEARWESDEEACWAHRRVHVYRLLSMGFGPPTPLLLRLLSTGNFLGYLRQALSFHPGGFSGPLGELSEFFRNGDPASRVASEYPRLFPRRVSPRGSDHGGPPAREVRRFYREAGLGPLLSPLPADHVSVEMAFLATLAEREMGAVRQGGGEEARAWARRFLRGHVQPWVPRFTKAVEATGSPFYSPLVRILTGWMALDEAVEVLAR